MDHRCLGHLATRFPSGRWADFPSLGHLHSGKVHSLFLQVASAAKREAKRMTSQAGGLDDLDKKAPNFLK